MVNVKGYTIRDIESMTEEVARAVAEDVMEIKGYNCYLIDFEGYFGYSICVFKNNHHIHYANDYELHHSGRDKAELKEMYIKRINNILYTEDELKEPIKNYDDYDSKMRYLTNYYAMSEDYVSMFNISTTEEEKKAYEEKVKGLYTNPVGFCYMANKEFVEHHKELADQLMKQVNNLEHNYDYWYGAFVSEMYNHEYAINRYQGNWDVLSVFFNVEYEHNDYDIDLYFKQLELTKEQEKAYRDAARYVLANSDF